MKLACSQTLLALSLVTLAPLAHARKIDPAPFHPEKAPALVGPYAPNQRLASAERLAGGQLQGPEEIAIDADGYVYTGTADGTIKKISRQGEVTTFANTGGHPLGLDFDAAGQLLVAEPYSGLLRVTADGKVTILVQDYEGEKLGLVDDVKVASDGRIYFTEASRKYPLDKYQLDFLEARANGRLFRYDPLTAETELLLDNLYFANGIALSAEEDFLIVAETSRYRLTRYWLQGPRAGEREIFLDNLPGLPDTISSNGEGTIWVAYFSVRDRLIDGLQPYPWLKGLLAKLPTKLLPKPKAYSLVVAYDENGNVLQALHDPTGKNIGNITSVEEYKGELYMGSLTGDAIGVIRIED
ncbi:MAG TPA: SMP-30/gluconolactonase/LRE family protein [Oligoflexus sp.]|uniref:SMP-30/gluconolactonase/LRE family protein n=1 Tax=Oligoflexus sp. TaxID=1971216 RepID=UPI002D503E48|nr:SMP-30/gluconolactonase/LRE family protein [Oligoflexus sp.]HYX38209.1 SMP-30/gluconolactonase/LRE family protein [Oligoflexus sp.]